MTSAAMISNPGTVASPPKGTTKMAKTMPSRIVRREALLGDRP